MARTESAIFGTTASCSGFPSDCVLPNATKQYLDFKKMNTGFSGHEGITPEMRELSDRSIKLHIRGEREEHAEWRSYSKCAAERDRTFFAAIP